MKYIILLIHGARAQDVRHVTEASHMITWSLGLFCFYGGQRGVIVVAAESRFDD